MNGRRARFKTFVRVTLILLSLTTYSGYGGTGYAADAPAPLLKKGQPVDWWFVFKLNSAQGAETNSHTTTGGTHEIAKPT